MFHVTKKNATQPLDGRNFVFNWKLSNYIQISCLTTASQSGVSKARERKEKRCFEFAYLVEYDWEIITKIPN